MKIFALTVFRRQFSIVSLMQISSRYLLRYCATDGEVTGGRQVEPLVGEVSRLAQVHAAVDEARVVHLPVLHLQLLDAVPQLPAVQVHRDVPARVDVVSLVLCINFLLLLLFDIWVIDNSFDSP